MKILAICHKALDWGPPLWDYIAAQGHQVRFFQAPSPPDIVIGMSISLMKQTLEAINLYPKAKLFCYNWDCYEWVWKTPRPDEYNYKKYGDELLRASTEVWVPSECTKQRTHQWWPWTESKVHTILSATSWWDNPAPVKGDKILCPLRRIPDPWCDVFDEVCKELNLPYLRPDHQLNKEDYIRAVSDCRFVVSHYYEASTGGLTLLEATYLGKPVLLSDSKWHGGRDYFDDRAYYFKYGDYDDFRNKLLMMYYATPSLDREECKTWITSNYSYKNFADNMLKRIHIHDSKDKSIANL